MTDPNLTRLRKKLTHIIARHYVVDEKITGSGGVDGLVHEVMAAIIAMEMTRDRPPKAIEEDN